MILVDLENNWGSYRCDPFFVVTYSMMNPTQGKINDDYCKRNQHISIMGEVLQPLQDIIGNLTQLGAMNAANINNMRISHGDTREFMFAGLGQFAEIFMNMFVVFQKKSLKVSNMFARLVGAIAAALNTAASIGLGASSLMNSPIGGFMNFFTGGGVK